MDVKLLDIARDGVITADDESTTVLAENNADVLRSTSGLELIPVDGEPLITPFDTATDDKNTEDDEDSKDLAEDNGGVL